MSDQQPTKPTQELTQELTNRCQFCGEGETCRHGDGCEHCCLDCGREEEATTNQLEQLKAMFDGMPDHSYTVEEGLLADTDLTLSNVTAILTFGFDAAGKLVDLAVKPREV